MSVPFPDLQQSSLEESVRALHDVANLVTSIMAASSDAATEIDRAVQCDANDPTRQRLLESAQESLILVEHAGRLATHVLRARPQMPVMYAPFGPGVEPGRVASLSVVLDLAMRAAIPIVEPHAEIRMVPCESVDVVGDERELALVFFNLFINAYQAIGEGSGGTIDVSFRLKERAISVRIRDSGPGMNGEQMREALRPGYSTRGGLGLGLAICRETVERLGGQIRLANADGLVVFVELARHPG
jgi:signal transduction histidine kinase